MVLGALGLSSSNEISNAEQTLGISYQKFKTPIIKVEVSFGTSDNYIPLPIQIYKLISKIEIMETTSTCARPILKMEIIEGSREPNSPLSNRAPQYAGGDFTNSSGFVIDLKGFSNGSANGSFSSQAAALIGGVENAAAQLAGLSESLPGFEGLGDGTGGSTNIGEPNATNNEAAKFLFSPRNVVKVTWGYAEDVENMRVFVGAIQIVRINFPESGHPVTEIVAQGPTAELEQFVPETGVGFGPTDTDAIAALAGIPLGTPDMTISELINLIGDSAGFEVIVSKQFEDILVEGGRRRVWAAGLSLHQYLSELARNYDAQYTNLINPTNGKPILVFLKSRDLYKTTTIPKNLMTYKGPGSILKSANITADFGNITGKTKTGFDSKGNIVSTRTYIAEEEIVLFEDQRVMDVNSAQGATSSRAGQGVASVANGQVNGNVDYYPGMDSPDNAATMSSNEAARCLRSAMMIEFTTVGFTKLRVGSCPFYGLGERFSGVYHINSVSHIIDSNGYVCRGMASGAIGGGSEGIGVVPQGIIEGEGSEEVQLFEAQSNASGASSNSDDYVSMTSSLPGLV